MRTAITSKVLTDLQLETIGEMQYNSASDDGITTEHSVDICLAEGVEFYDVKVLRCNLKYEDVLLGMDILHNFDLSLTGKGDNRTFELSLSED